MSQMRDGGLSETRSALRFAIFFSLMMVLTEILTLFFGAILAAPQAIIAAGSTIGTIAIYREYRQRQRSEMARLAVEYDRLYQEELIRQIEGDLNAHKDLEEELGIVVKDRRRP